MKTMIPALAAGLVLAGCGSTATTPTGPQPAGFADGTKITSTPDLIFTATSKGAAQDASGNVSLSDVLVSYRTTADPNVIFATVNGEEIQLDLNVAGDVYEGSNANYDIFAELVGLSISEQVTINLFSIEDLAAGAFSAGYAVTGLETDPASVATMSGTASYSGVAEIIVVQEDGLGGNDYGFGIGTGNLDANFGTGTISGSISLDESGASDAGFEISSTTITIAPTTISGNGFSSTLSGTAADLAMTSVDSSSITGTFFGVDASDVGATFSGSGVGLDGVAPAVFFGGFIGE